jgi:chemotaxis protein histidine kinase CheA
MDRGHNENAVRLAALAGDAQIALDRVARGEADAIEGWLAYGAALNEGRALCTSEDGVEDDRSFGKWLGENDLRQLAGDREVEDHERKAAMWAAANADQMAEAKANSNARTLRGWHDQWKKIEAEREKEAKRLEAEAARKEAEALAAAARKDADEKAAAEAEARKAAAEAKSEADRKEAEARAADAAAAKEAAEKLADEAAAAVKEPEPDPDPHAAERKKLGKLTTDALIDEALGLRDALADAKATIATQKAEIEHLNERLAEALQGDMGRALGNAQRRATTLNGRLQEQQAALKRMEYRMKKAIGERDAALRKLEDQVIPL